MESATIHTPLSTGLSSILIFVRTQYSCRSRIYKKNINTISMHGEKFYQLHTETTKAVVTLKYSRKTDPSEIERTYTIRKQQTQF